MRAVLKMLGVTYFVSPSQKLVVHVHTDDGIKVYVKKLYTSKILRIFAEIIR